MSSRKSTRVKKYTFKSLSFKMELLVKDYEESISSVEKLFEKFTEAMLAHSVDPVLSYKETLEKALDKSSTSVLAVKELCSQSDDHEFNEEYQTKVDLLSQRGLELLTDICCLKPSLLRNRLIPPTPLIHQRALRNMS